MRSETIGLPGSAVDSRPILSGPIFHDMVKSILQWDSPIIYELCKTIPSLKSSNLLTGKAWMFDPSWVYQEHQANAAHRFGVKMDVVWRFRNKENDKHEFWVTHEVKTGRFDPDEIKEKYYRWQSSQIWIWGWERYAPTTLPRSVRFAPLESLSPIIKPHVDTIASFYGGY